jgi:hypothetical protein
MSQTIKLNVSAIGGLIQGNFGTYQAASDGTAVVDTRDVPSLLVAGATYVNNRFASYNTSPNPAAANAVGICASGSLANGAIAIAHQPDVMRQVAVLWGAGTLAISAGTVAITYTANDGTLQTDNVSLVSAASGVNTTFLSKGVVHLQTPTVSGLTGGAAPYIELGTTASISVPVDPGAKDVVFLKETIGSGDEAVGTVSTTTLATIAPTTAPVGALGAGSTGYSFAYTYTAPDA